MNTNISQSAVPYTLQIAKATTKLDDIEIIPVNKDIVIRKSITVLKIGDWEKRLIYKCASYINKDIKHKLIEDPENKFYVYTLGEHKENKLFIELYLRYTIRK
jgi:hypothetical protein